MARHTNALLKDREDRHDGGDGGYYEPAVHQFPNEPPMDKATLGVALDRAAQTNALLAADLAHGQRVMERNARLMADAVEEFLSGDRETP